MFEITNPITKSRFQVALTDFDLSMDWSSAVDSCINLGNGWRLPSFSEFTLMYSEIQKSDLGNFSANSCYWTDTEHDGKHAYFFHINDRFAEGYYDKEEKFLVRAVRTL